MSRGSGQCSTCPTLVSEVTVVIQHTYIKHSYFVDDVQTCKRNGLFDIDHTLPVDVSVVFDLGQHVHGRLKVVSELLQCSIVALEAGLGVRQGRLQL